MKPALRAGVDCIEHGVLIDAEAIAMMKERGVPLVPTVYVLDYIIEEGEKTGIPADRIAKARALQKERDAAIRANAATFSHVIPLAAISLPTRRPHQQTQHWPTMADARVR